MITNASPGNSAMLRPFTEGNKYFIFDGLSLSVAEVSKHLYEFLNLNKGTDGTEASAQFVKMRGTAAHASALRQFSNLRNHFASCCTIRRNGPESHTPGLCEVYLSLSAVCNLSCAYCFSGHSKSDRSEPRLMSQETAERSLDFIFELADPRQPLSIVLWGGEPLLNSAGLMVVLSRIDRERSRTGRRISVATTTNATLLTPQLSHLLARHKVVVNLSLDGTPESHDRFRRYADGRGSFGAIRDNLAGFLDIYTHEFRECIPRARLTITRQSVPCLFSNYIALWDLGIPVVWSKEVSWTGPDCAWHLKDEDFAVVGTEFARIREYLVQQVLRGNATVYPQVWWDTHGIQQKKHTDCWCGAGVTNINIATDGSIYSCYHLAENYKHRCGSVFTTFTPESHYNIADRLVDRLPKCHECDLKYLCGGGCVAKSIELVGDPYAVDSSECTFARIHHDHRLKLYASLMTSPQRNRIHSLLKNPPHEVRR